MIVKKFVWNTEVELTNKLVAAYTLKCNGRDKCFR